MNEILPFVHPLLGGLALLAMAWTGSRGLLARQGHKGAHTKRRSHVKWAPYAGGACIVAAVTGLITVAVVRDDMTPADTAHFWLGWGATAMMGLLWWVTPRRYRRNGFVKNFHPFFGVATVLVGVAVLLFGIELLP